MKKLLILMIFTLIIVSDNFAQDYSLNITALYTEKSNELYSFFFEYIYIINDSVEYAVERTGSFTRKKCLITNEDKISIWETIVNSGLLSNDSLLRDNNNKNSSETGTLINILIISNSRGYKVKVSGDTNELEKFELYQKSIDLIKKIRLLVNYC